MTPAAIAAAADFLADLRQRRNGRRPPIEEIPESIRPTTLEEGYAVQEAARPLIAARGRGAPAGWKIGSTSPPMQAALGIPSLRRHALCRHRPRGPRRHRPGRLLQARLECEIAVRPGADLPAAPGGHPGERAARRRRRGDLDEIVEWRFVDFRPAY
jgi:2-keto-4-pentenoate hydratase